ENNILTGLYCSCSSNQRYDTGAMKAIQINRDVDIFNNDATGYTNISLDYINHMERYATKIIGMSFFLEELSLELRKDALIDGAMFSPLSFDMSQTPSRSRSRRTKPLQRKYRGL